jgi:hypothetical protein
MKFCFVFFGGKKQYQFVGYVTIVCLGFSWLRDTMARETHELLSFSIPLNLHQEKKNVCLAAEMAQSVPRPF